jgi:hypothetical protein
MSEKALPKARGKAAVGKQARRNSPGQPPKGRNLFSGKLPHPNGGGNNSKGSGPLRLGEPGPGHFSGDLLSKGRRETPSLRIAQIFLLVFIILALLPFVKGILLEVLCRFWGFLLTFGVSPSALKYSQRPEKFSGREKFFPKGCGLAMVRGSGYNHKCLFLRA